MTDAHPVHGVGVVVVAAGAGTRLGAGIPKAFVEIAGRTILDRALDGVEAACPGASVVAVVPPDRVDACAAVRAGVTFVAGGAERSRSVAHGLAALGDRQREKNRRARQRRRPPSRAGRGRLHTQCRLRLERRFAGRADQWGVRAEERSQRLERCVERAAYSEGDVWGGSSGFGVVGFGVVWDDAEGLHRSGWPV